MQQRLEDNYVLNRLISAFESKDDETHAYFEDKELLQILTFYENELDYGKALEVAQHGLNQYAFNSDFYLSKARVLLLMEEFEEALTTIEDGLAIAPNEMELELLKIHTQTEAGNLLPAKKLISKLITNAKGEDRVDLLICQSYIFEKEKDFEGMFNALKKALMIEPNQDRALEKIWIAVEICKNYKESILLHKYIIDRNPYNHRAWYNLGHAYACLGEYPESIMSLEYSFLIDEKFEVGYKDCAEMCFQIGRFRQALSIYLDAYRQFGPDMELLVSIGRCYLELDNPSDAYQYLKQAVKVDPYDDEAHYYQGLCHFRIGRFEDAIQCFAEAIKLEDRREEYYADIAKSYHLTGKYTLADYYFNKATEAGPEEMKYWFHHIVFLFDIQAYEAAAEVLAEAEYHTYGPEIQYIKSALAFAQGDKKNGINLLTEAVEEDASMLSAFYALIPNAKEDNEIAALVEYYKLK